MDATEGAGRTAVEAAARGHAIAVIGLGCRYPGASDPATLWQNILARRQAFRRMPDCRLPLDQYHDPDPTQPDKTYLTRAAVLEDFAFDWRARRIPKSTFDATDIAHWLALDVALQALGDAGYAADTLPRDRTAVILGNSLTGEQWRATIMRMRWPFLARVLRKAAGAEGLAANRIERLLAVTEPTFKSAFAESDEDTLAGSLSNTIAGRICNYLDLRGGGYTVDGACSSSLLAVINAADRLRLHEIDLAFAGGVDVSLDTFELIGFAKTGALTAGEPRIYDRRADGFLPGEGCGIVVLKRLEDARRDGDYVYAVLNGWGVSSDGKGGITAPTREGQALALGRAYALAGYPPSALDFIEGHGTGTRLGDTVELGAIALALEAGDQRAEPPPPGRSCGVTSFKSLVGHTKAAAGVGGLIKAVLALHRRVIPPTVGCQEPHPIFEEQARRLYPVTQGEPRDPAERLRAGVSAMGFGGINTHVTLASGDPPDARYEPPLDERLLLAHAQQSELIPLTAASVAQLLQRVHEVERLARGISVAELADLAALLAREADAELPVRAALVMESPQQLGDWLGRIGQRLEQEQAHPSGGAFTSPCRRAWLGFAAPRTPPRIAFVFPGQGVRPLGMARQLVERFGWARELVEQADTWLAQVGAPAVGPLIFRDLQRARDAEERARWKGELVATEVAQPAIALVSLLWLHRLERLGVRPSVVAGHSLGELTALRAAHALDDRTLLQLAARRGAAMAEAAVGAGYAGGMAGLRCSEQTARELIADSAPAVVIANHNSPEQIVVSGPSPAIAQLVERAQAQAIDARQLAVSAAFHSPQMEAAAQALRQVEDLPARFEGETCPVVSSMTGRPLEPGADLREHLARQICAPVDFCAVTRALGPASDLAIEIGPGQVLCDLLQDAMQGPCLPLESRRQHDADLHVALAALFVQGIPWQWESLHEGRLIRPFVPATSRRFIENPCERPLTTPALALAPHAAAADAAGSSSIEARVLAQTGLSPDAARAYLEQRGSFLSKMIGKFIELDLEAHPLATATTPAPAPVTAAPGATPAPGAAGTVRRGHAKAGASVEATLLRLVAQRTGFPQDSLELDYRMLDDLHLDSIKSADLVNRAANAVGVAGELDTTTFANASLGEIAEALARARSAPAAAASVATPNRGGFARGTTRPTAPAPAPYPSWTRNFVVCWEHEPLSPPAARVAGNASWAGARVLLVAEPSTERDELAAALQRSGASVELADFSAQSAPAGSYTDHVALFPESSRAEGPLEPGDTAAEDNADPFEQRVAQLCAAVRTLPRQPEHEVCVSWLRRGKLAGASWSHEGFAASLHLERPGLRLRALGFDASLSHDGVVAAVARERAEDAPFIRARYDRRGQRHVPSARVQRPATDAARRVQLGADDVVLITGGAKGITAECALALGQQTGAQLVLVGSSAETSVTQTLDRFRAAGVRCAYQRCDLRRQAEVEELVAQVRREHGPIVALVHGAGLNRPGLLKTPLAEDALAETAPKLLGAVHLFRALEATPPQLVVALTSVIGFCGMPGNAWYALVNECLDLQLGAFAARHPETEALAIGYSAWEQVGMAAELGSLEALARMGVDAISPPEGVRRFMHLVTRDPGARQVLVSGRLGQLDTWPRGASAPPEQRFLEHLIGHTPGVELSSLARLSLARDPYLIDHNFDGSHLFPTVFGLEAMAQAVAHLTGRAELRPLHIDDITLERPIVVDPERGLEVQIHALALETSEAQGPERVSVRIRSAESGFQRDHFAATFVLEPPRPTVTPRSSASDSTAVEETAATLALDPQQDLYGSVLFQGPCFQRLREVIELDAQHCVLRAERRPAREWLLGDPYFRDALLQSAQLPVTPEQGLPVRIDRWEIFTTGEARPEAHRIATTVQQREGDTYRVAVDADDEQGHPVESLRGYRCRMVGRGVHLPSADELVLRGQREVAPLREQLREQCQRWSLALPELALQRLPGLHTHPSDVRHRLEHPLMTAVARGALRTARAPDDALHLRWSTKGKPAFDNTAGLEISLAHDETFCLCVAGPGPQGCDIEPIASRSPEEWLALLGPAAETLTQQLARTDEDVGREPGQAAGEAANRIGTFLWTASEALKKALGPESNGVLGQLEAVRYDTHSLLARVRGQDLYLLCLALALDATSPRIVALVLSPRQPTATDGALASDRAGDVAAPAEAEAQELDDNPFSLVARG